MAGAAGGDQGVETSPPLVGWRRRRESGTQTTAGIGAEGELADQQQAPAGVGETSVHAAPIILEDTVSEQALGDTLDHWGGITGLHAGEHQQAGADGTDDLALHPHSGLGHALQQDDHAAMLGSHGVGVKALPLDSRSMRVPLSSRLLWCLAWLAGCLPVRWRLGLARLLAARDQRRNSKRARVARTNLSLINEPQHTLAGDTLFHAAATLLESFRLWTRPASANLAQFHAVDGLAHWQAARQHGGVLVIAPHHGNWELLVQWLAAQGPFSLLYTRGASPASDGFLRLARERHGVRAVPADAHGMKPLLRSLQRGEIVGITPDQRPDGGAGLWSPFFGQPALTMTLIPRLLQRTSATPVLAAALRESDGRFRLVIRPAGSVLASTDLQIATDAMNAAVEAFVRETGLAQYQWTYKRFRGLRADGTHHNPYRMDCY